VGSNDDATTFRVRLPRIPPVCVHAEAGARPATPHASGSLRPAARLARVVGLFKCARPTRAAAVTTAAGELLAAFLRASLIPAALLRVPVLLLKSPAEIRLGVHRLLCTCSNNFFVGRRAVNTAASD
jgi:hypothetical protein